MVLLGERQTVNRGGSPSGSPRASSSSPFCWFSAAFEGVQVWMNNHNDQGIHFELDGLDFVDNVALDYANVVRNEGVATSSQWSVSGLITRARAWADSHDASELCFEFNGLHPMEHLKLPRRQPSKPVE